MAIKTYLPALGQKSWNIYKYINRWRETIEANLFENPDAVGMLAALDVMEEAAQTLAPLRTVSEKN